MQGIEITTVHKPINLSVATLPESPCTYEPDHAYDRQTTRTYMRYIPICRCSSEFYRTV